MLFSCSVQIPRAEMASRQQRGGWSFSSIGKVSGAGASPQACSARPLPTQLLTQRAAMAAGGLKWEQAASPPTSYM